MKTCTKCKVEKESTEFHKMTANPDGLHHNCKKCRLDHKRESYQATGQRRAVQYGISVDTLNRMLDLGCNICKSKNNLVVDHDHSCCPGKSSCGECVRGVLCGHCNTGLGMFRDNIDFLKRAIAYLENC